MIRELRAFLAMAEIGSIQGASRRLPLTQSAVTRQIQRLEADLGCMLLDRSVKPPRLTREGEEVRARGKRLIEEVSAFRRSFAPDAQPSGIFRLGIANAALDWRGSHAVAQAIVDMARVYPDVSVRLSAGWTPRLLSEVNGGTLDAAVVIGRAGAPWPADVVVTQIAADQLIAVGSRELGISRRTAFSELLGHPWVLNPDGCGYRTLLVAWAASLRREVRIAAEVQGASLQRDLIARGLGVGLVPEAIARNWQSARSRRQGRDLVLLSPRSKPFGITVSMVSTTTTQRLRQPIEVLGAALGRIFVPSRKAG